MQADREQQTRRPTKFAMQGMTWIKQPLEVLLRLKS